MSLSKERSILLGIIGGVVLLAGVGVGALWTLTQFKNAAEWRSRTYILRGVMAEIESAIKDSETGQRGYILTGDDSYLEPFTKAERVLPGLIGRVRMSSDLPEVQHECEILGGLIGDKLSELRETINLKRDGKADEALALVKTGKGKRSMDQIRASLHRMQDEQDSALEERDNRAKSFGNFSELIVIVSLIFGAFLGVFVSVVTLRELHSRRRSRNELAEAKAEIESKMYQLAARNLEIAALGEMSNQLQSCQSLGEAYQTISLYCRQILTGTAGAAYLFNSSRDALEVVTQWGADIEVPVTFHPDDCWALRRGVIYRIDQKHQGIRCRHAEKSAHPFMCVPMLAHGEVVGLLHVEFPHTMADTGQFPLIERLAATIADQISLAVANLRLREKLRNQSIRDALTGLFNRRYMEESLAREMKRAARSQRPLSVIMIDLDHFKALNDTYGHEAGDETLAAVAAILKTKTRSEDIACRYGGEELIVVMPEAGTEAAELRSQGLCEEIRRLRLRHQNSVIEVTASMGVATFPVHGSTSELLMRAADLALYKAKHQGRNQVVMADLPV